MKKISSIFIISTIILGTTNLSVLASGKKTNTPSDQTCSAPLSGLSPITTEMIDQAALITKSILLDEYREQELFGNHSYHHPDKSNDYLPGGVPEEMKGTVYYYSNKFLRGLVLSTPDYINTHIPNTITAFLPVYGFEEMRTQMSGYLYNLALRLALKYKITEAAYIPPEHFKCCECVYNRLRSLKNVDEYVKHFVNGCQLYVKLDTLYQTVKDHDNSFFLILEDNNSIDDETHFHIRLMRESDIYPPR